MKTVVFMELERDTAGARMYKELDENGAKVGKVTEGKIGQVYTRKTSEVGQENPRYVRVTMEAVTRADVFGAPPKPAKAATAGKPANGAGAPVNPAPLDARPLAQALAEIPGQV